MSFTNYVFSSQKEHRDWLAREAVLPAGFRVGCADFSFTPKEVPSVARMTLSLVVVDRPSADFAAVFTRNAFPGAPVVVGRRRLDMPSLGAILVNNKVSNVRAPDGEAAAERVCAGVAHLLGLEPWQVFPSSTGVIGWRLPEEEMLAALPGAVAALSGGSALPVAEGIVTTDLYPKVRRVGLGAGSIVAFGKGAGMIEPNLATMLVYVLTDIAVPRATLRAMLARAVDASFNTISIDGEMSTSDTVAIVSSGAVPCVDLAEFEGALTRVCRELAGDIVRNGEGVRHVVRVRVVGAPDNAFARALGKSVVNAPLFKCAVAGNDPNVGRLVQAVGKHIGIHASGMDISRLRLLFGGVEIFADGVFRLDPEKEALLREHLRSAELYASKPDASGFFAPQVHFPPHERFVEIVIELGAGEGIAEVIGGDLTHEYVSENADYRS